MCSRKVSIHSSAIRGSRTAGRCRSWPAPHEDQIAGADWFRSSRKPCWIARPRVRRSNSSGSGWLMAPSQALWCSLVTSGGETTRATRIAATATSGAVVLLADDPVERCTPFPSPPAGTTIHRASAVDTTASVVLWLPPFGRVHRGAGGAGGRALRRTVTNWFAERGLLTVVKDQSGIRSRWGCSLASGSSCSPSHRWC